jgi:site-specific recombinase XerD
MGVEIDLRNVRAKQVQAFLTGNGPITRYWRRKYDTLRGLYRYATSRGLVADTPLPISVPKLPERFVPYIYTRDELRRLLDSTACFPKYPRKLQADTLRAVLLLLYGAGLRVSEAVALTLEDVDLSTAVITIRDTKFNKTRLVPLGPELNRVMAQYAASRNKAGHVQTGSAPFFVLRRGRPVPVQLVEQRFRCLREHAGVSRADGARYQPRLHDLIPI